MHFYCILYTIESDVITLPRYMNIRSPPYSKVPRTVSVQVINPLGATKSPNIRQQVRTPEERWILDLVTIDECHHTSSMSNNCISHPVDQFEI